MYHAPFLTDSHHIRVLTDSITKCLIPCVINRHSRWHPMIIFKTISFVYKPKAFWIMHPNDHFTFKTMCLFVGSEFLVSHHRLCKPRHFTAFHRWGLCLTIIGWSFTRGGFYPCLLAPNTYFILPFHSTVRLNWTSSRFTELTQSNTKHSVDSPTMHSHPFITMSPCICNAMFHCTLCHVTCMINATWTILSYECHHAFHVNISSKHISTSITHVILYSSNDTHTIMPCNGHFHTSIQHMLIY